MTQVALGGVGVEFGPTTLFTDITVTISAGERWGVIGRNGTGSLVIGLRENFIKDGPQIGGPSRDCSFFACRVGRPAQAARTVARNVSTFSFNATECY